MNSPFNRFTDREVREILRGAGLPETLDETNVRRVGLTRIRSQKDHVLSAYRENPDVDFIFNKFGGRVPKSSIRAHLSRAEVEGIVGSDWRIRRPRKRSLRRG